MCREKATSVADLLCFSADCDLIATYPQSCCRSNTLLGRQTEHVVLDRRHGSERKTDGVGDRPSGGAPRRRSHLCLRSTATRGTFCGGEGRHGRDGRRVRVLRDRKGVCHSPRNLDILRKSRHDQVVESTLSNGVHLHGPGDLSPPGRVCARLTSQRGMGEKRLT